MADLSTGADSVGGERFGNCEYNDIKNHFRDTYGEDPCSASGSELDEAQPGMIISNETDDRLYHVILASGCGCSEILQDCVPLSDDKYWSVGDDIDGSTGYDELTNDAWMFGIPVDPKRGVIVCDIADLGVDFTGLITAHTQPVFWFVDLDNDSYLGVGHQADDRPGIWSGAADTSILALQYEANADITVFENATSGETKEVKIYGFRAADALRSLEIGVGVDAADTASFDGVSNYYFDGNVGIGIVPPLFLLHGFGAANPAFVVEDNGGVQAYMQADATYAFFGALGAQPVAIGNSDGYTTIILDGSNLGVGTGTFGTNMTQGYAQASGVAPITSPANAFQMWSMDVLGVADKAGPHWRSEENGMYAWHGGAGTINSFTYQADVADEASFTLPAITDAAWGFVQAGNNEEYALFTVDDDGDVTLISNSANVVANADIDGKICIGTAPAQEGLVLKNRLGAQKNINLIIWYS